MLGLIIKDLLVCKKNLRTVLILVAIFTVFGLTSDDTSFITLITCLYFSMMVLTAFAYDTQAKWDAYGMTMPVSRSETVLAKYLLGAILSAAGTVLSLIVNMGIALYKHNPIVPDLIVAQLVVFGVSFVILGIIIPLIYRFGVEKTRLIMIVIFVLPSLLVLFFAESNIPAPSENILRILVTLSPFLVVAWIVLSYLISVRIFTKKEL